jgi:hypothetical protein
MPNNRAYSVALFIYQNIYCRYLCPGECIIQDRGEACNKICDILASEFSCEIRVISAGRPQSNGQAESAVKSLKTKMKCCMIEAGGDHLDDRWDETLLFFALQVMRSDPSRATGYAPAELLLGRPLVFPIEMKAKDIDMSGVELTRPLFDALNFIRRKAFGIGSKKIKKEQERFARAYDKKHAVIAWKPRKGMKCQVRPHVAKKGDKPKGAMHVKWNPARSHYYIHALDMKTGMVRVRTKGGMILKTRYHISNVRKFNGI